MYKHVVISRNLKVFLWQFKNNNIEFVTQKFKNIATMQNIT